MKKSFKNIVSVNALSGCYLISTMKDYYIATYQYGGVNALSGCYLISTKM